jgi:hypothetical protein
MIDICKYCEQSLEKHLIRNYNNCPLGRMDSEEIELFSHVNVFYPMDNLDYVEYLAKKRKLL